MTDADARPSGEDEYPKTCETDDCHRRAIYLIKGANPPDTEQRVVCEPCYNLFQWCGGVPYSDVWSEQIRPKTATDGGATPRDVGLQEVTGVVWTDDDGTQYRRTIENGEIVDREINQ